ncbi:hypothetical protein [Bacillus sp. mrc49]|uniref:hypothetical protein n=1 Tax=Bacillus sp. mrc49 TaxID=2054913 RepID=UPI000C276DF5|nr:hypothetical protein [Bacillus sp. mrc49]PJN88807.1 hypothetical protein CVN76_17735 [Bacillus sp. mrc49]
MKEVAGSVQRVREVVPAGGNESVLTGKSFNETIGVTEGNITDLKEMERTIQGLISVIHEMRDFSEKVSGQAGVLNNTAHAL